MKQHIWTPHENNLLQFLIDKQHEGYRFVAVAPKYMTKEYTDAGHVVRERQVLSCYIVIGEGPMAETKGE
jgi:hypothetical protein